MKGFKITDGDLSISNNEIDMVYDNELKCQTVQSVLSTNKGEWLFNLEEGINFKNVLGKNVDEKVVKSEIEQGQKQVDATLAIEEFAYEKNEQTRKSKVRVKSRFESGETVEVGDITWD